MTKGLVRTAGAIVIGLIVASLYYNVQRNPVAINDPCVSVEQKLIDDPKTHNTTDKISVRSHFNVKLQECFVEIDGIGTRGGSYAQLFDQVGGAIASCAENQMQNIPAICVDVRSGTRFISLDEFKAIQQLFLTQ